jgi:hypothetical protein
LYTANTTPSTKAAPAPWTCRSLNDLLAWVIGRERQSFCTAVHSSRIFLPSSFVFLDCQVSDASQGWVLLKHTVARIDKTASPHQPTHPRTNRKHHNYIHNACGFHGERGVG